MAPINASFLVLFFSASTATPKNDSGLLSSVVSNLGSTASTSHYRPACRRHSGSLPYQIEKRRKWLSGGTKKWRALKVVVVEGRGKIP